MESQRRPFCRWRSRRDRGGFFTGVCIFDVEHADQLTIMAWDRRAIRRWERIAGKTSLALRRGEEVETLSAIIADHADMLACFLGSETLLHAAARGGNLSAVQMLIESGLDVDLPDKYGKTTPLCEAISGGSAAVVRWLLEHGARIEGIGEGACATPLVSAAMKGDLAIVQLVIDHGANVNAPYELGEGTSRTRFNALKWAVAKGHDEVAELLRRQGAVMPSEEPVVHETAAHDLHLEVLQHMRHHVGPVNRLALVEIVPSGLPPIAINVMPATADRNSLILFTTGMSEVAMNVPEDVDASPYAELYIELPANWPLSNEALEDDCYSWPIHWLRNLARQPHETNSWLGSCLVVSNGDPPEPLAPDTLLSCIMLLQTDDLGTLQTTDGRTIRFYQLLPMFREERDLLYAEGVDALADLLGQHNIDTAVDIKRINVALE